MNVNDFLNVYIDHTNKTFAFNFSNKANPFHLHNQCFGETFLH